MASYWKMLCVLFCIIYIEGACSTIIDYSPTAATKLSFASYYSDHMVLQRGPKRANVWGYADKQHVGKTVDVTLSGTGYSKVYKAAVKSGPGLATSWEVQFDPVTSKDPFQITAQLMSEKISISDVLFGDVWLCGGQSNMCFTVMQIFNATQELENAAKYKNIRVFSAKKVQSKLPYDDLEGIDLHWALPNKTNLGNGPFSYFSAVCWLYGRHLYDKLQYPIGLVESAWGGTPVEAWSTPVGLASCGLKVKGSYLWNSMIHPLIKMTIYGAIWYQGEANSGSPDSYNCTFPAMIKDWRMYFHLGSNGQTDPKFPFGFVQLAPVMPQFGPGQSADNFAAIRWHQTMDVGFTPNVFMENVFMATAVDLPDSASPYGSVHPRAKEPVGYRLAQAGLAIAYGVKNYPSNGPQATSINFSKNITISYKVSIEVRSQTGFEICCQEDGHYCNMEFMKTWSATKMTNYTDTSITLELSPCTEANLKAIRYIWQNTPCEYMKCPVYDKMTGLPQAPFYYRL